MTQSTSSTALNTDFLLALLREAGPSGFEARPARVWLKEAATFARTRSDFYGNAYAEIGAEDGQPIVLMGHLDEIGLMVSHVDDQGFLAVLNVGGWDPQVLVGQRIRLLAPGGDVLGVIGKKAIHVMEQEERSKASKLEELWIDTGMSAEQVKESIPVGTVGVIEQPPLLLGDKLVSRALDNRVGAFIVLEALRKLHQQGVKRRIVAVGTAQEELGIFGAQVSSHGLDPLAGIAVDVTHETDQPGVNPKKYGKAPFGSGANLSVGAMFNPRLTDALQAAGKAQGIPFTLSATPRHSSTDGDALALARAGVPAGVVSIPNRYMHSPSEMVQLSDVQACIDIIAAWIVGLPEGELDFSRH
ncbi:endoglucanase [Deinococcus irradiatisoli]|uniref:Endoglucanase n=1 Tax=Deinococcus irradiatisoli TaxID=2202254 RepID=A0A2Z3JML9_9DEIO|nr:M20/M25/M40 family metallo-hydrolase [Deinococcus irradiatisoli]AWN22464.1 endoglucanase [Deinococcus irradiatisoli]